MEWIRRTTLTLVLLLLALPAQAQLGPEIARKHAGRAGEKLAELIALRAEGRTFINKEVVPFTMIAQRPNRLRVESFTPQHRVVQGYDGSLPPWVAQGDAPDTVTREMTPSEAKDFMANADFDGPLVDFEAKGYSVDYAGEEKIDGKPAYKLLLMNKRDDIFFLWLDQDTMEIVKRSVFRVFNNQRVSVDTFFKEYRSVAGVLQPHRVETLANNKTIYVMLIDKLEANPSEVAEKVFQRPPGK